MMLLALLLACGAPRVPAAMRGAWELVPAPELQSQAMRFDLVARAEPPTDAELLALGMSAEDAVAFGALRELYKRGDPTTVAQVDELRRSLDAVSHGTLQLERKRLALQAGTETLSFTFKVSESAGDQLTLEPADAPWPWVELALDDGYLMVFTPTPSGRDSLRFSRADEKSREE